MNGSDFCEKLKGLRGYALIFTRHAELRLVQRQINRETIISDIRNPVSLKLVEKLQSEKGEEKYKLWFIPYSRTAFVYVIVINPFQERIIVKTVIKQKLGWQKKVEKNAK